MTKTVEEVRRAAFDLGMREILLSEGYFLLTVPEIMARGSDGRYGCVRVRGAWEGFNLALDAVEIQLPSADHYDDDSEWRDGYIKAAVESRAAIEQTGLGLKVKP